jgi:predicted Zn-dependent peptidase
MSNIQQDFPAHFVDQETALPNGVRVVTRAVDPNYYHPVRSFFAVNVMAGARHAGSGRAHFLEHLVAHKGHDASFEKFGTERDYDNFALNAITNPVCTTYDVNNKTGTKVNTVDLI